MISYYITDGSTTQVYNMFKDNPIGVKEYAQKDFKGYIWIKKKIVHSDGKSVEVYCERGINYN